MEVAVRRGGTVLLVSMSAFLFAGIGYFTLPYLVHAGAGHVHACEWNPDAVEALTRNLQLNGVADRCTVHAGDNRNVSEGHYTVIAFHR